ncbi:MAG: Glucose-repressible alcohol dehydrogenase transcriptional effector [Claussenomyces sp. TS43310]|nr:MAG: Glucose-repressible alcohol dehydrogenase transcriptional effector [Claussenomyces sp. TS43310]
MFGQNHQAGQMGRVNGGPGSQRMPLLYSGFQNQQQQQHHQSAHQQQSHTPHQNIQQDHTAHTTNGSLTHHSNYSSGAVTNATPNFTANSVNNGHSSTTRGGQAQLINEHWAEQLKIYKETQQAHNTMLDQHAPNHYARTKGHENRSIPSETTSTNLTSNASPEGEPETDGRSPHVPVSPKRQDWQNMDMSGQGLRVLTAPVFAYTFLNDLYIASNQLTHLPPAIGRLRQLTYLDASFNLLADLPPELGMCVFLKQLLLFNNKIRTLPNELGALFQLEMLGIEGCPLDQGMKQEIMERGTKSLIHHLREQAPVPLPPPERVMFSLHDEPASSASQERFKVFSYNTLCDKYCTEQLYGYTPSSALSWEYRKEQILQEVQSQDADIITLQEIDTESFHEFFSTKLAYNDYKGVYWPKSRARTMSEKDAKAVDGCATFYRASKYILLDKQLIDFAGIAINRPDMKSQHDIFNRVMPRDHIAVVTFFENRLTGGRLIVVNTHLCADPVFADVKLIQTAILMEQLTKISEKYARWPACKDKKLYTLSEESEDSTVLPDPARPEPAPSMEYTSNMQIPLLVCGDFNSTPDSAVYELLSQGSVRGDHPELGTHQYGNFTRDGMQHPFSLRSSYASLQGTAEALPFTDYTPGFTGVIEYIWYATNALEVTSLLGPIDPEYMKRVPGFPSYHFPSDHLSLAAGFQVKGGPKKDKKLLPEPDFGPQRDRRH